MEGKHAKSKAHSTPLPNNRPGFNEKNMKYHIHNIFQQLQIHYKFCESQYKDTTESTQNDIEIDFRGIDWAIN